ncbi:hypothetical protein NDU88_005901 [Pleurodeles waltl]|uniref:Uncharacterized protein n=1 Tax=Pleurodeles waltl TaxID=8319 RepID=A0AAV7QHD1_PLEWA|nr:hypothetical protein NDU88_005901 [Pleurodeles waltl]
MRSPCWKGRGTFKTALVKWRKMVTGGAREAAMERRSHSQETGQQGDKEKRCNQETVSRWLKGESHKSTTVKHAHSERNRSRGTEIQRYRETEEGEDALQPPRSRKNVARPGTDVYWGMGR